MRPVGIASSAFFAIMPKRGNRALAIEPHRAGTSRPEVPFGYEKREYFLYFGELMEVRVVLILALVTKFHEAIFVDKECVLNGCASLLRGITILVDVQDHDVDFGNLR
jgi:hypothetical protein